MSTTAAFHLTGVATARGNGGDGDMNVFFQHQSGEIRRMSVDSNGHWTGGDHSTIVTQDAKDGSPVSVFSNTDGGIHSFYFYFIASNNQVRERIGTQDGNGAVIWREGPLSSQNVVALDDPNAAMQVCYSEFYNQTDPADPSPYGMRLWYAVAPTTIRTYYRTFGQDQWTQETAADYVANGKAGIGCYTWTGTSIYYLMVMNLDDTMNILYRDARQDQSDTAYYKNTTVVIGSLMPNTSMGFTDYLFAQHEEGWLTGFSIHFDGADTQMNTSVGDGQITTNQLAIAGSHFAVTKVPNNSTKDGILSVFLQLPDGKDVTQSLYQGDDKWNYQTLNLPAH
jgi:hypothetical protein